MQNGGTFLIVLIVAIALGFAGYHFYKNGSYDKYMKPASISYGTESKMEDVTSKELSLSVSSPQNNVVLASNSVILKGTTAPNADVFVNDKETKSDAYGNFEIELTLDEGINDLVITANDAEGNVVEQNLSVNVQTY